MKPTMKLRVMRVAQYASDSRIEHLYVPQQFWEAENMDEFNEWLDLPLVDEAERKLSW